MARPRLLGVCTLPPWPVIDGLSLRVANLLRTLSADWDITLLAPGSAPGVRRHLPLSLQGTGLSYPWRFDNRPLAAALEEALRERPDAALVWPGAEGAWLDRRTDVPAVLDIIDCNPLEFARAAGTGPWLGRARAAKEAAIAAFHTRRAVRGFGATACVGEADAAWMRRLGGRTVYVVPNGVTLPEAVAAPDPWPTVVFSGTLDYGPNVDAVAFMSGAIWPRIRADVPGARWMIAGRRPVAAVRALEGRDGIRVLPDVVDMAAAVQAGWLAVAPMRLGVGLKNKVLEAWASARPVVLTPCALNGLRLPPGHAGLVQAGAPGFAAAVVELLRDASGAARLGDAARSMVAQEFTWERAASRIDALLLKA